jgi:ribulose-phosphate 3-epimerase
MKTTIGASIICMDHLNFEWHTKLAECLEIDYLHLDIMDGHLVPRYGIYPEIVHSMASLTNLDMDLHLMVSDVEFALSQFQDIPNIKYVSIHLNEEDTKIGHRFDRIREYGKMPVLVVDQATSIYKVSDIVNCGLVDGIMFMGIHPGVLKQTARPELVVAKLNKLHELCDLSGLFIQCDGGVNFETIPSLKKAGVNNFICGSSSLYKGCNLASSLDEKSKVITQNKILLDGLLDG